MDEEKRQEKALFRYGCIGELLHRRLAHGEQARLLRELSAKEWEAPKGRVRIPYSTLKAWLGRFRKGGFGALKPKPRRDKGKPRVLSPELIEKMAQLKREMPSRSVPGLIRIVEADPSSGVPRGSLRRATVYRHLKALGLTERKERPRRAYRRFERERPGELLQLDEAGGLYLRQGEGWRKTVLFLALDDHSRYAMGRFYFDAKMPRLENFTRHVLTKGVPDAVYVDHAKIHVSRLFRAAMATLEIRLILGTKGEPSGRGKMERFVKTVKEQFYPEAKALIATGEIGDIDTLNEYFFAWLEAGYNSRVHSETGEEPRKRYFREALRLPDPVTLVNLFLSRTTRIVRKTATVSLLGRQYHVDEGLVGSRVEVRYDPFDADEIEVWMNGRFHQIAREQPGAVMPKTQRPSGLTLSYLKLLKAEHDRCLALEIERIRFSDLPADPGTLPHGTAPFVALLEEVLGRKLDHVEVRDTQLFLRTYGPFDDAAARKGLEKALATLGRERHIISYLEILRDFQRGRHRDV